MVLPLTIDLLPRLSLSLPSPPYALTVSVTSTVGEGDRMKQKCSGREKERERERERGGNKGAVTHLKLHETPHLIRTPTGKWLRFCNGNDWAPVKNEISPFFPVTPYVMSSCFPHLSPSLSHLPSLSLNLPPPSSSISLSLSLTPLFSSSFASVSSLLLPLLLFLLIKPSLVPLRRECTMAGICQQHR